MKNYETIELLIAIGGIFALCITNYRFGRYYEWRNEKLVMLVTAFISAALITAAIGMNIWAYSPNADKLLSLPFSIVIGGLLLLFGTIGFSQLFILGDRLVTNYVPNPNNTYSVEDLPGPSPEPTEAE